MKEFLDLLHSLYEDELYDSTLLLSETFYIQTNTIDFMYFIIKSLHKLSHLHRVIDIINQNKVLLENYDIKKIYLKAISETKLPSISIPHNSTHVHKYSSFPINEESILLYHKAKVENDIIKYKLLVKSFEIDERNLQALFVIKLYSLCDNTQFNKLIDSMQNKILSTVYKQCFYQNINPVDLSIKDDYNTFSPFTFLNHARTFYKSKDQNKLFSLAVFMNNKYPNCFISTVVLGLYYLLRKQYPEAKKCFYDSITKNNEFGLSWLYFGISLSHLKEGMNTLSSFRNAKKYMIGSYKPKFYLAREFSLLNVPESALCYYKEIVSNNKIVNFYYAIFLLHEEMPNDLKIVLSRLKNIELDENEKRVLNLLMFFQYLGATKLVEAERILDNGITDWRYYLCKGYCYHIKGDLVKALEYYHEAEVHCESKVALLEDLMKFSMLDKREGYGIDIVDYLIDVFDSLNLYSLFELPI